MTRTEAVAYLQDLANRLHGESEYVVEATATLLRTGDNVQQILSECTLLELCRAMAVRCDSLSVLATLRPEEGTEEHLAFNTDIDDGRTLADQTA